MRSSARGSRIREEDVSVVHRPRQRIHLGEIRQVLRRARRAAAPNDALLPQQNGVVERQNQTIVRAARSLLMTVGMPKRFWREAVIVRKHSYN